MAKRKRLKPAMSESHQLRPEAEAPAPLTPSLARAPIAAVAQEAAAVAALQELSDEMHTARSEGRLLLQLPLELVDEAHLVRDRLVNHDQEMAELKDSLRRRGQQTAIEVVDLGDGRYGLISGWRRLAALRDLAAEGMNIPSVLAIVRQPRDSAEAYLAMVEENEVRADLSYFERARIVARAAEQGVYPDTRTALSGLFASASRSKRSKIGSFLTLVEHLEGVLRFPAAIGERLGLALSQVLTNDPGLALQLSRTLQQKDVDNAEAEGALLSAFVQDAGVAPRKRPAKPAPASLKSLPSGLTLVERKGELVLGGDLLKKPGVRAALIRALETFKP